MKSPSYCIRGVVVSLTLFTCSAVAGRLAGPAPEPSLSDALPLALRCAKEHLPDASSYHIVSATYASHSWDAPFWLFVFGKPNDGFFLVGVYPDGKVVGDMRQGADGRFLVPNEKIRNE